MEQNEHSSAEKQLRDIRSLMADSSRFLTLSGLSGIYMGISIIVFVVTVYYFKAEDLRASGFFHRIILDDTLINNLLMSFFALSGAVMIIISLGIALFFTMRFTTMKTKDLLSIPARRMATNLFIPLISGGLFCMILMYYRVSGLLIPTSLIFYGLALVNAGKYTYNDIRSLGLIEISLGLIAAMNIPFGLIIWAFGFGVLHILYGAIMYFRYEK